MTGTGIQRHYLDALGRRHRPPAATVAAITRAMAGRRSGRRRSDRRPRRRAPGGRSRRAAAGRRHDADDRAAAAAGRADRLSPDRAHGAARRAADRRAVRVLSAAGFPRLGLGHSALCGAVAAQLGDRRPRRPAAARAVGAAGGRGTGVDQPARRPGAAAAAAAEPVLSVEPALSQPAVPEHRGGAGRARPAGVRGLSPGGAVPSIASR